MFPLITFLLSASGTVKTACNVSTTTVHLESQEFKFSVSFFMFCLSHLCFCLSLCRYSLDANTMMHKCECCQEATTSQKEVMLTCGDGSQLKYSYTDVLTCSCTKAQFTSPGVQNFTERLYFSHS
uniref:CTCK domain-containing protein n=1 Tax=Mastacembelus armatus TaxID=205130 RepID=A0A3Q3LQG0_9TELE